MKEFEKFNNKIINSISSKIIDYIKNLYEDVKNDLSSKLTNEEIKREFKNALITEYDLKEIVTLNVNDLDFIKDLKEDKNDLGVAYSQYIIDKTTDKIYKTLDREIFNKKEKNKDYINSKNKALSEKIKEKRKILENNKSTNVKQKNRSI